MPKFLKGKMIENWDSDINDFTYIKGQIVDITELESFKDSYAVYHNLVESNILDWIPKDMVEVI